MLWAALLGAVLAICPRGLPGRWVAALLLLPAMTHVPPAPAQGAVWLEVLDAGQGLAAVVRTREHVLVYDTGPRFGPDFDAGSAVVLPWLRRHGVSRVDTLLVSHGDNDHAGGAPALLRELRIGRFIASAPDAVPGHVAEACRRGMSWHWDGVDFTILHPDSAVARRRNDASCVLMIRAGGGTILLPGDIEARAERALLARGDDLRAHIVVAPHHGSRSSSGADFVAAVAPAHVLFATGYRNRWGFPHPEVQARYAAMDAGAWNTAVHGAVEVRVPASGVPAPPRAWRELHQRYWHPDWHPRGAERSGHR
jgi:competence protein ComEC